MSLTMRPSRNVTTRDAHAAMSCSCVTSTMVMPRSRLRRLEEREDLEARARVEVAGGLVGEEHRRARDERARDRDALLLAAGELVRCVMHAIAETDGVERLVRPLAPLARARRRGRRAAARRSRAPSCAAGG